MKKIITVLMVMCCAATALAQEPPQANAEYVKLMQVGMTNFQAGKFSEARKNMEDALAAATTPAQKAKAQINIGETYNREGNIEQARNAWKKVQDITDVGAPDKAQAQIYTALSYRAEKKPAEARAEFNRVIANKDAGLAAQAAARQQLGDMALEEKNYTEARTIFAQVLESRKTLPLPMVVIAMLQIPESYMMENKFAQAREEYSKILQSSFEEFAAPDAKNFVAANLKPNAQLQIARSYLMERNYTRAKEEFAKVGKMAGANPVLTAEAERKFSLLLQLEGILAQLEQRPQVAPAPATPGTPVG